MDERQVREAILDALAEAPGSSTREIADRTGRTEWTIDYHLRRLSKEGAVNSETLGRNRCWYVATCGFCPVLRRSIPHLRRPEALAVAMAASETPASSTQLAARAGLPTGVVRWASGQLVNAFVLERTGMGRLSLRPGAQTCVAQAAGVQRCGLWGKCYVSRQWKALHAPPAEAPPPRT